MSSVRQNGLGAARELELLSYAAIGVLLDTLTEDEQKAFPFLQEYGNAIASYVANGARSEPAFWWREAELNAAGAGSAQSAVSRLRCGTGLSQAEVLAVFVTLLPEQDAKFAEMFAALGGAEPNRYPTTGFLIRVLEQCGTGAVDARGLLVGLVRAGLLEHVPSAGAASFETPLRTPPLVWSALNGTLLAEPPAGIKLLLREQCPRARDLHYPVGFLNRLAAVPMAVTEADVACVELRHDPGTDVQEISAALARALGRHLLILDTWQDGAQPALGAAAHLANALLLLAREVAPGETLAQPDLGTLGPPPVIAIGRAGGLELTPGNSKVTLDVPFPAALERLRVWRDALGNVSSNVSSDVDPNLLDFLAQRFQVPLGHIRSIARGAIAEARLRGDDQVQRDDMLAASRQLNRQQLDVLAEPLTPRGDWSWLITRDITQAQLQELSGRCRMREALKEAVSAPVSTSVGRGVRALFTGPSGTGKTMAARILAHHLGQDIYRVDLGAVVNKYVGETEKNLHKVLSFAEALDVILLLDEGDALLGQRTDVKSANDRYANLETNYLLQRFETYQGIILVTTNLGDNIDRAFKRRMDVVVPFYTPRAEEREALWNMHLPDNHLVTDPYLDRVVRQCALTGGQIRNAVAHAGALALEARRLIDDTLLGLALVREQQKAGTVFGTGFGTDDNPVPQASAELADARFNEFVSMLQAIPRRRF